MADHQLEQRSRLRSAKRDYGVEIAIYRLVVSNYPPKTRNAQVVCQSLILAPAVLTIATVEQPLAYARTTGNTDPHL